MIEEARPGCKPQESSVLPGVSHPTAFGQHYEQSWNLCIAPDGVGRGLFTKKRAKKKSEMNHRESSRVVNHNVMLEVSATMRPSVLCKCRIPFARLGLRVVVEHKCAKNQFGL